MRDLVNKADKYFSQVVRLNYCSEGGLCKCYTCGRVLNWKEIQCGHYIPRSNLYGRYNFDNCRPQCVICNEYNRGEIYFFRELLINEIGEEKVLDLEVKSRNIYKLFRNDIVLIIEECKKQIKEIKKEKSIN